MISNYSKIAASYHTSGFNNSFDSKQNNDMETLFYCQYNQYDPKTRVYAQIFSNSNWMGNSSTNINTSRQLWMAFIYTAISPINDLENSNNNYRKLQIIRWKLYQTLLSKLDRRQKIRWVKMALETSHLQIMVTVLLNSLSPSRPLTYDGNRQHDGNWTYWNVNNNIQHNSRYSGHQFVQTSNDIKTVVKNCTLISL